MSVYANYQTNNFLFFLHDISNSPLPSNYYLQILTRSATPHVTCCAMRYLLAEQSCIKPEFNFAEGGDRHPS